MHTFVNDFLRGIRIDDARAVYFECSIPVIGFATTFGV